ncbi:MAG: hypothetical protein WAV05_19970, partial [Anaerolineales bacterium]
MYNRLVRKGRLPDDLSIEELRQLLVEKRRKTRLEHLERFRKTGRVVTLTPDLENPAIDHLHSESQAEADLDEYQSTLKSRTRRNLDRLLLAIEILAVI